MVKRIGILTGGGDCPGLNAVIRAVTKDAIHDGREVVGILDGYAGFVENRSRPLLTGDVSGILAVGGTILGTSNTADPFNWPDEPRPGAGAATPGLPPPAPRYTDASRRCLATIEALGLSALVIAGGDGTMTIAARLAALGVPCIGLPKTIDNDVAGTDITFGFQTAVATATDALDRVHTTAASHHRVMIVEVMGRNAGWLALHAGLASGTDVILLPEMPFRLAGVCEAIAARRRAGKRFSIVCVGEGARPQHGSQMLKSASLDPSGVPRLGGIGTALAAEIEAALGVESRCAVLGHVQRGGAPIAADRVLATQFGHHAASLLRQGAFGRMARLHRGELGSVPLDEVAGRQRTVPPDHPLIAAARAVFTTFGE